MIDLKEMVINPRVLRLCIYISQRTPESLGRYMARIISGMICLFKPSIYHIAYANLHQVLGPDTELQAVQKVTRQMFGITIQNYFHLFRTLKRPVEDVIASVHIPEETLKIIHSLRDHKYGKILVSAHLGNFDLGTQIIATHMPRLQLITVPNPPPVFRLINTIKQRTGLTVTPLSRAALREAFDTLTEGGAVLMTGDRIVSDTDNPVPFFGRAARMPTAHVRMALKTDALIALGCCVYDTKRGGYIMHAEPPISMIRTGNHAEELEINMRNVLDSLERIIRRWPEQWQMFAPVWSEE